MGVSLELGLRRFGFLPVGQGEITGRVSGLGSEAGTHLKPMEIIARGALRSAWGRAVAANLPPHIPQRVTTQATAILSSSAPAISIEPQDVRAASAGAGLFLTAEYDYISAGFNVFAARGRSSETVSAEAACALSSRAALVLHLADQALLPLALGAAPSTFTCETATRHLETNAWVIGQFGIGDVLIERQQGGPALVWVRPKVAASAAEGRRTWKAWAA
jgi:RNA 3'-terminal phosphate cyclase (ATP)